MFSNTIGKNINSGELFSVSKNIENGKSSYVEAIDDFIVEAFMEEDGATARFLCVDSICSGQVLHSVSKLSCIDDALAGLQGVISDSSGWLAPQILGL
jgi:hypothetical protein